MPGQVVARVEQREGRRRRVALRPELPRELGAHGAVHRRREARDHRAGVEEDVGGTEPRRGHRGAADGRAGHVHEVERRLRRVGDHAGVGHRRGVAVGGGVAAEGEGARGVAGGGGGEAVGEDAAEPGRRLGDQRELRPAEAHEPRRAAEQAAVAEPAAEHEAVDAGAAERDRVRGEHAAAERPVAVGQRVVAPLALPAAAAAADGGAGSRHAGGRLEGGFAGGGIAGDGGVGGGAGRVEQRVALRVADGARLTLHPGEVAAGVDDDGEVAGAGAGGSAAAERDGGDVVERLEADAGGQGDLGASGGGGGRRRLLAGLRERCLVAELQRVGTRLVGGEEAAEVGFLGGGVVGDGGEGVVLQL